MKKFFILPLITTVLLLGSCKTDFDITANWKEIMVVYGLLSQNDSIHYVKITKAFLGEGDALAFAQIPDSSNYHKDDLEVRVEEWDDGAYLQSFSLDTITKTSKEPGIFYYPTQQFWYFKATLNKDYEYKLFIKNKKTVLEVSSATPLVNHFTIDKPPSILFIGFTSSASTETIWRSAKNGRLYDVVIRFNYAEKEINKPDSTYAYVDWLIGSVKSSDIDGGEVLKLTYTGDNFYSILQSKILANPDIKRNPGKVEFIFSVAGDDFSTYMDVTKPSSSIIQEKPEYTNINNGIGIFSCRYKIIKSFYLNVQSIDSLRNGRFTNQLGF